jgi:hypothetical protein
VRTQATGTEIELSRTLPGLAFVVGDQGVVASIVAHLAASGVHVAEPANLGAALVMPLGVSQQLVPLALSAREMQVATLVLKASITAPSPRG